MVKLCAMATVWMLWASATGLAHSAMAHSEASPSVQARSGELSAPMPKGAVLWAQAQWPQPPLVAQTPVRGTFRLWQAVPVRAIRWQWPRLAHAQFESVGEVRQSEWVHEGLRYRVVEQDWQLTVWRSGVLSLPEIQVELERPNGEVQRLAVQPPVWVVQPPAALLDPRGQGGAGAAPSATLSTSATSPHPAVPGAPGSPWMVRAVTLAACLLTVWATVKLGRLFKRHWPSVWLRFRLQWVWMRLSLGAGLRYGAPSGSLSVPGDPSARIARRWLLMAGHPTLGAMRGDPRLGPTWQRRIDALEESLYAPGPDASRAGSN